MFSVSKKVYSKFLAISMEERDGCSNQSPSTKKIFDFFIFYLYICSRNWKFIESNSQSQQKFNGGYIGPITFFRGSLVMAAHDTYSNIGVRKIHEKVL